MIKLNNVASFWLNFTYYKIVTHDYLFSHPTPRITLFVRHVFYPIVSVPNGMEVNKVIDEVTDEVADEVAIEVADEVADKMANEVADGFLPHLTHIVVWCVSVPNGMVDKVTRSHGLSARRAWKTRSSRPSPGSGVRSPGVGVGGPLGPWVRADGQEVGDQWATRLLVFKWNFDTFTLQYRSFTILHFDLFTSVYQHRFTLPLLHNLRLSNVGQNMHGYFD